MSLPSLLAVGPRASRRALVTEKCAGYPRRKSAWRAPSTRRKQELQQPRVISPEREAKREGLKQNLDKLLEQSRMHLLPHLTPQRILVYCRTNQAVALAVSRTQALFLLKWREGEGDRIRKFDFCKDYSCVSLDEVYALSEILRKKGTLEDARIGKDILFECSTAGHQESTIQVVASALRQDHEEPGVLKHPVALHAMDRLRTFAPGNVRALVLEANIARHTGATLKAIALYEAALDLIVKRKHDQVPDQYAKLQDEYSTPWIELAHLHISRNDHREAVKAYMVGIGEDDPMAYFNLATLDYIMSGNQYSLDWLHNMTKAAASGYFEAAYKLGEYYGNTPVTPTQPPPPLLARLKEFSSFLYRSNINLSSEAHIKHHEAFAKSPSMRIKLAIQWLTAARRCSYLPANISLALLYLQKFIYPSDSLSRPLDPFGDQPFDTLEEEPIENPMFDPEKALDALTEVVMGCAIVSKAREVSKTQREFISLAHPISLFPEVLEALQQPGLLQELVNEAGQIADAAGIDIRSTPRVNKLIPQWGLIRKHKGVRGEGLDEVTDEELASYKHGDAESFAHLSLDEIAKKPLSYKPSPSR